MSEMTRYSPAGLREAFPEFADIQLISESLRGAVFNVKHRAKGRRVALKVTIDQDDPLALSRFEREVRILHTHRHERLVEIYAEDKGRRFIRMANGNVVAHFFLTMKLYSGDVASAMRSRSLDLCSRIIAVFQMLEGLAFLHSEPINIAHRDIKPANLFLENPNSLDQSEPSRPHSISVKLGDFDIAKASRASLPQETVAQLGTPYYLAPERWDPISSDADWRPSDQYAAGITAFEILAEGERPFDFSSAPKNRAGYRDVHERGQIRALVIRDKADRAFPNVAKVLCKMMEVSPALRYGTIGDCIEQLKLQLRIARLWPCPHGDNRW